jgi:hypothetical protein
MVQTMKRIVLIGVAVVMLASWALPAYALSPRDPGPVGVRVLPSLGSAYCENFYDGPPVASAPSGDPLRGIQLEWVYWCQQKSTGYWVATSPTI